MCQLCQIALRYQQSKQGSSPLLNAKLTALVVLNQTKTAPAIASSSSK